MTNLLQSQIETIILMICCGMTVGMVHRLFTAVILKTAASKTAAFLLRLGSYIIISFIIGEFIMFCQNGKILFYEAAGLIAGLLLWRKIFCDKIDTR